VTASLGMHSQIFVMPETIFFRHVVRMLSLTGASSRKISWRMRVSDILSAILLRLGRCRIPPQAATDRLQSIGKHLDLPSLATCQLPRTRNLQELVNYFVSLVDDAARSRACQVWVEQSPVHVRYLGCIQQYVPDARVLHVVRDGRAVVASLWDAAHKYDRWRAMFPTIDTCIETWNTDIAISRLHVGKTNHFHINYHRFAADVGAGVRAAAGFLGVDASAELADQRDASRVALPDQLWLQGIQQTARDEGLNKFHSLFSAIEQLRITHALTNGGDIGWCP
jgi:hypothetical protein